MQPRGTLLLDDGVFFVEHNVNYAPESGNGFLHCRCPLSSLPGGSECVGSYVLMADGKWHADVNTPLDEDTDSDCRSLGAFDDRLDAIGTLWRHRHEAYRRYSL
jgi:hypothetical protein